MPVPLPRTARAAAAVPGSVLLLLVMAVPASAAPPISWEQDDDVSTLEHLLIVGGVPLGLFLLLALLVMAPSIAKGTPYRSHVPWYQEPMQFGTAPRDQSSSDADTDITTGGGASVRW